MNENVVHTLSLTPYGVMYIVGGCPSEFRKADVHGLACRQSSIASMSRSLLRTLSAIKLFFKLPCVKEASTQFIDPYVLPRHMIATSVLQEQPPWRAWSSSRYIAR